jgi:ApaG protein
MNIPYPIAVVRIEVNSEYLEDQSIPMQHIYTFGYQIRITNTDEQPLTLRRRFWQITDDNQHIETVEGEGVVGQQPTLQSNESFVYTSGVQLKTPFGQMQGHYTFESKQGELLSAPIPAFLLSIPRTIH